MRAAGLLSQRHMDLSHRARLRIPRRGGRASSRPRAGLLGRADTGYHPRHDTLRAADPTRLAISRTDRPCSLTSRSAWTCSGSMGGRGRPDSTCPATGPSSRRPSGAQSAALAMRWGMPTHLSRTVCYLLRSLSWRASPLGRIIPSVILTPGGRNRCWELGSVNARVLLLRQGRVESKCSQWCWCPSWTKRQWDV